MHIRNYLRCCIIAWAAVAGLAAEHHVQVKFGGLPVPGATVTAVQGDKRMVAITDQQGAYSFAALPDGIWTIQVEMLCFGPIKQEVAVAPDAPSPTWELKLLPFDEIKASAPPPLPPGTPAAAVTSQIATAPSAKPDTKGSRTAKAGGPANASTGFQRTDVNASPDAAEPGNAASDTGNLPAADQNQNASDAFVVNGSVSNGVERRAIGNARRGVGSMFRGDLSLILDNSTLDARQFSFTGQDTAQPSYDHLKAGASFGGPLIIPHLIHGQGQFFVNYQMTRNTNANTQAGLMPDSLVRSGDLSHVLNPLGQPLQVLDPGNGAPFPGNVIPQGRISPQATALLSLYPLPNFDASTRYNYQIPVVGILHQDDVQSRVNKMLNSKNFVNGTFGYRNSRAGNPNIFGFLDTTGISGLNTTANWRHIFNQRVNLNLGYQFSRFAVRTVPFFAAIRRNVSFEAGI